MKSVQSVDETHDAVKRQVGPLHGREVAVLTLHGDVDGKIERRARINAFKPVEIRSSVKSESSYLAQLLCESRHMSQRPKFIQGYAASTVSGKHMTRT